MMIRNIGTANVHIINKASGSGTERRLKDFWKPSGFMARTSFIAGHIHFCRARSGVRGKVFGTSTSPTLWTIASTAIWASAPRRKGRRRYF